MALAHRIEAEYADYAVQMERLDMHLEAVRQLGLDGVETVGEMLDEIGQTRIGTDILRLDEDAIKIGDGLVLTGERFSIDGGSLRANLEHYCLNAAGLLIARPVNPRPHNKEVYVVPSNLPGDPDEWRRSDQRFLLDNNLEFRCESFAADREGHRADQVLVKLGEAFLKAKLGHPSEYVSPIEDLAARDIEPADFIRRSTVTFYEFDTEKLEEMIVAGVQEKLKIKKLTILGTKPVGFYTK